MAGEVITEFDNIRLATQWPQMGSGGIKKLAGVLKRRPILGWLSSIPGKSLGQLRMQTKNFTLPILISFLKCMRPI